MGMPVLTPSNTSNFQAITDIIESVALEQAALSHILNAEGEKIQKVVATATTSGEMLAVNSSVQSMIGAVTRLEVVLQGKLELFKDCLCDTCSYPQ